MIALYPSHIIFMVLILVINGPNLNMLGKRNHRYYGQKTLSQINREIAQKAKELNAGVKFYQSNHEGDLIDFMQKESADADGIIINPGALTHYSYALYDALVDTSLPVVEVHLSNINNREPWRRKSVIAPIAAKRIMGKKEKGYLEALEYLVKTIKNRKIKL